MFEQLQANLFILRIWHWLPKILLTGNTKRPRLTHSIHWMSELLSGALGSWAACGRLAVQWYVTTPAPVPVFQDRAVGLAKRSLSLAVSKFTVACTFAFVPSLGVGTMDGGHTFTVKFRRKNISKATKGLMQCSPRSADSWEHGQSTTILQTLVQPLREEAYSHWLTAQDQTKPIQTKPNQPLNVSFSNLHWTTAMACCLLGI